MTGSRVATHNRTSSNKNFPKGINVVRAAIALPALDQMSGHEQISGSDCRRTRANVKVTAVAAV
jgi:hypothetical protein